MSHSGAQTVFGSGQSACVLKPFGEPSSFLYETGRRADGLVSLPSPDHRIAFVYGCLSQEFNFERRTAPSLGQNRFAHMRALTPVAYWDIDDFGEGSARAEVRFLGEQALLPGSTRAASVRKVRIFVHPFDEPHMDVFRSHFGEPQGSMPGLVTSSMRTLLILPERERPFFVKLNGSVVLESHFKALLEHEVWGSVETSRQLRGLSPSVVLDPYGVLFDAAFLPGIHATRQSHTPREVHAQYPDADVNPRIYHQLFRAFPALATGSPQPQNEPVFIPGHSLFSEGFIRSELGVSLLGAEAADARRWLRLEVLRSTLNDTGRFT